MTYTTLYDEDEADADEKATNDWTTAHAMLAQVSVTGRDGRGAETLDGRRSGDVATDRAAMGGGGGKGGGGGDPRLGGLENPLTPAEQGAWLGEGINARLKQYLPSYYRAQKAPARA